MTRFPVEKLRGCSQKGCAKIWLSWRISQGCFRNEEIYLASNRSIFASFDMFMRNTEFCFELLHLAVFLSKLFYFSLASQNGYLVANQPTFLIQNSAFSNKIYSIPHFSSHNFRFETPQLSFRSSFLQRKRERN